MILTSEEFAGVFSGPSEWGREFRKLVVSRFLGNILISAFAELCDTFAPRLTIDSFATSDDLFAASTAWKRSG